MNPASSRQPHPLNAKNSRMKQMERKEWWLWSFVVVITMLLTGGIASFALPLLHDTDGFYGFQLRQSAWGLLGLVLLFDIYSLYQQFQIQSVRRQLVARDELFRVISENAADMIAVVDMDGNRIYNSLSYQRVLGYSPEELQASSAFEQIHPEDLERVRNVLYCRARPPSGVQTAYPNVRSTALLGSEGCCKDCARLHSGCRRLVARQYSTPWRNTRPRGQRSSGDFAVRRMPHNALHASCPVVCCE